MCGHIRRDDECQPPGKKCLGGSGGSTCLRLAQVQGPPKSRESHSKFRPKSCQNVSSSDLPISTPPLLFFPSVYFRIEANSVSAESNRFIAASTSLALSPFSDGNSRNNGGVLNNNGRQWVCVLSVYNSRFSCQKQREENLLAGRIVLESEEDNWPTLQFYRNVTLSITMRNEEVLLFSDGSNRQEAQVSPNIVNLKKKSHSKVKIKEERRKRENGTDGEIPYEH